MSTTTDHTISHYVSRVLAHGTAHVGGRDGARRHAQDVIDRARGGQCFLFATEEDVDAAQAVVDAYTV